MKKFSIDFGMRPKYLQRFLLYIVVLFSCGFVAAGSAQAAQLGTNVEFRTDFAGVAGKIGSFYAGEKNPVTAVIRVNWDDRKVADVMGELTSVYNPIIVRLAGASGGQTFTGAAGCAITQKLLPYAGSIAGVEFGNEINNLVREWQGGTIASYVHAYREFASCAPVGIKIGPAALDPYFETDARSVASQIAAGNARINVLFFNAYERRSEAQWAVNSYGCDLPWEDQRSTACSWKSIHAAYGSPGVPLVLTEFSLHPDADNDDLCLIRKFIEAVGPRMGVAYATPLVQNVVGVGPLEWLYYIALAASKFVTFEGQDVTGQCGPSKPAAITRPYPSPTPCDYIGGSLGNTDDFDRALNNTCQIPTLEEALRTNRCEEKILKTTTWFERDVDGDGEIEKEERLPDGTILPWDTGPALFDADFGGSVDNPDILSDVGMSRWSTSATLQLPSSTLDRLASTYVGGVLSNKQRLQELSDALAQETNPIKLFQLRLNASRLLERFMPYRLPGSKQSYLDERRTEWVNHSLGGIANQLAEKTIDPEGTHDFIAGYIKEGQVYPSFLEPTEGVYRPIRYTEIACRDSTLKLDETIAPYRQSICDTLYGVGFGPSSSVGGAYGAALTPGQNLVPSHEFLYESFNNHLTLWDGVVAPEEPLGMKIRSTAFLKPWDPDFAKREGAPLVHETFIGIPFGRLYETVAGGKSFANAALPYSTKQELIENYQEHKTDAYCRNQGVYESAYGDPVDVGSLPPTPPPVIDGRCWIGDNCTGVLGATVANLLVSARKQGDVLQAATIIPGPDSETSDSEEQPKKQIVEERHADDTRQVIMEYGEHPQMTELLAFLPAAAMRFFPYFYIKEVFEQKIAGTGVPGQSQTAEEANGVSQINQWFRGTLALFSDFDKNHTDKPVRGAGGVEALQRIQTTVACPYPFCGRAEDTDSDLDPEGPDIEKPLPTTNQCIADIGVNPAFKEIFNQAGATFGGNDTDIAQALASLIEAIFRVEGGGGAQWPGAVLDEQNTTVITQCADEPNASVLENGACQKPTLCYVGYTYGGTHWGPAQMTDCGWLGTNSDGTSCGSAAFGNAIQMVDPNRVPNRCRFRDSAFAVVMKVKTEALAYQCMDEREGRTLTTQSERENSPYFQSCLAQWHNQANNPQAIANAVLNGINYLIQAIERYSGSCTKVYKRLGDRTYCGFVDAYDDPAAQCSAQQTQSTPSQGGPASPSQGGFQDLLP